MTTVSELLNRSFENGGKLLLDESDLVPDFFNLRSGFAGELMQKFVNYDQKLAVVVRDPGAYGERFMELCMEHERHRHIRFTQSDSRARTWLAEN